MTLRRISLALLLLTVAGCTRGGGPLEAGRTAPDFRAEDLTGRTHYLNAELAQPLVLTFFATWCLPCREEIPLLIDLHKKLSGRAQILCVAVDPENKGKLRVLVDGLDIPYPMLLDDGQKIMAAYGVAELPVTFVIDREGLIRSQYGPIGQIEASLLAAQLTKLAGESR
ncbi:MAG: TlpA disulfide reductase family protein [Candidatus Lernaella stagnicola]|nr:TlpA disulfide reductase family protein [Candidatus Lernaella stagnicola]